MRLRFSKDRIDEFVKALQGNHVEEFARPSAGANFSPSDFISLAVASMRAFEQSIGLPGNFDEMNFCQQSIMRTQRRNAVSAASIEFHGAYSELRGIHDEIKLDDVLDDTFLKNVVDGKADLIVTAEGNHSFTAWERPEGVAYGET